MRSLALFTLFVVTLYIALCSLIAWNQNSILFHPTCYDREACLIETKKTGLLPWETKDGAIIGARSHPVAGRKALLVFHGNGGDAISRSYLREVLGSDWIYYLAEYPGYGARPGEPGESSIRTAALEAIDLIQDQELFLLGESLGSGVAAITAAARPNRVKGLFLISPYPSLVAVAGAHYSWLPVSLLLKTKFDAKDALKGYHGPIAFAVGEGDGTIPNRFGKELYESYADAKEWWSAPNAGHSSMEILMQHWPAMDQWMRDRAR